MVGLVALLFFVTQAGHGITANTADALFFERFGVENLPLMILLAGVAVLMATLGHIAGLARFGVDRWLWPLYLIFAGAVLVENLVIPMTEPWIYPVIWLTGQVTIMVTFNAVWNAAAETCNTRQAKRLFPLFASAGIAGGIVGNLATGPLAIALGTENLLIVQALLHASGAFVLVGLGRRFFPTQSRASSGMTAIRDGLRVTRASPLMRQAAMAAVALSALFYLVLFPFSTVVAETYPDEAALAGFLGYFSAAATAVTFVFSLLITARLLARLGVVWTLAVVPAVYLAGFAVWLVAFDFGTAVVFRGVQWVAVNAVLAPVWSSLFNIFTGRQRSQLMAFNAALPKQIGVMAAGAMLLLVSVDSPLALFLLGLAVSAVTMTLVNGMRSRYTDGLMRSVRKGVLGLFASPSAIFRTNHLDADLEKTITASLDDPRPGVRATGVAILAGLDDPRSVELIERSFNDETPVVRSAALAAAHRHEMIDAVAAARTVLGDVSPRVRISAIGVLLDEGAPPSPELRAAMHDAEPLVRAGAAVTIDGDTGRRIIDGLLQSGQDNERAAALEAIARARSPVDSLRIAPETVAPLLDSHSLRVRRAAARALLTLPDGRESLDHVLATGSVRASQAVVDALAQQGRVDESLVTWADGELRRAQQLGAWHRALDDGEGPPAHVYLRELLESRRRTILDWALVALSCGLTTDQVSLVTRGVWAHDRETRAQAVEALETMSTHSGRGVIKALEDDAHDDPRDEDAALVEMAADFDPWIGGLARRLLPGWGPEMESTETLGTMDRVLALRQVRLFTDLDPEDLDLIAQAAKEVRYEPGEGVYRLGEEGNEMLVIIGGEAVISREAGGEVRVLNTLGSGEAVGELALIRREPRMADVTAGDEGLHGLVIEGPELLNILQERPEVAMAMLATLAERLGKT